MDRSHELNFICDILSELLFFALDIEPDFILFKMIFNSFHNFNSVIYSFPTIICHNVVYLFRLLSFEFIFLIIYFFIFYIIIIFLI